MFGIGCLSFLGQGTSNTARSLERLREIEVIDGALSPPKMMALDYTMKILAEKKSSMTKDEFREKMLATNDHTEDFSMVHVHLTCQPQLVAYIDIEPLYRCMRQNASNGGIKYVPWGMTWFMSLRCVCFCVRTKTRTKMIIQYK